MNVASLENCKRLYELSGWWDDNLDKYDKESGDLVRWGNIPAYDLGYLLRKLPLTAKIVKADPIYGAWLGDKICKTNDTPEDACALLAIKLFEDGLLGDGNG